MKIRLVARTLAALALATTIYGCSSAPQGETEAKSEAALRVVCNPFEALQCSGGDFGPAVCGCASLTGPTGTPVRPQLPDFCGDALPPPAELPQCTPGMVINAGQVWLCPVGTVLPQWPAGWLSWTANEHQQFVSNCVGNIVPRSGYLFVGRYHQAAPGGGCGQGCTPGPGGLGGGG